MTAGAELGRTVLRTFQNLRQYPANEVTLVLDATRRAGAATDLALRLRCHGRLGFAQVREFARFSGLSELDLRAWCLEAMRDAELLDYAVAPDGRVTAVEEQVGLAQPVLEAAARLWEGFGPGDVERCALAAAGLAATAPLALSDHRALLEREGHALEHHGEALAALRAIQALRASPSPALDEDVVYSPYVWGQEAAGIAAFAHGLADDERARLLGLTRRAAARPGVPFDQLGGDTRLLRGARKVGLIDGARVLTADEERGFAFPPHLERLVSGGQTDATHERKLFVAHVLNGHYFGQRSTGRIEDPVALVQALLDRGTVGPTTAARTDYLLLESAGIVRARLTSGRRAYLELVKRDVARDALGLIALALSEDGPPPTGDGVWLPAAYTVPERDRMRLPEVAGAEQEVVVSVVERLRTHAGAREALRRRLRGEELVG
jgi:hypothetical protein